MPHRTPTTPDLILKGDDDGDLIDIDTLLEKISYTPTKQAMQCSIRFLESRGLVARDYEMRRKRRRVIYSLTPDAIKTLYTAPEDLDIIE